MKVFVGICAKSGYVHVEGPLAVTAHGGRWFVYVPQCAGDPIVKVRTGSTPNYATMTDEQAVTPPPADGGSAFIPAFRAILTLRGNKVVLDVVATDVVAS